MPIFSLEVSKGGRGYTDGHDSVCMYYLGPCPMPSSTCQSVPS